MSKKQQQNVPTLSPIASAMYNAQRKEITSSIITSLVFLAVGGIVTLFSIFKYFKISGSITDSSEKVDAFAWLVIAGVGIGVVAIGIVNMLKSFTSLGQLGSMLKRTESHASPFQDQQLSRRVAQMNQSQAMKNAEIVSAEQRKQAGKKGFGLFGKRKMSSSELYDKYNPPKQQNQTQRMTAPPKSRPMMEQKFDYGLHEEKEMTFADEFLMKNKRDPFAQYRKELGIKEEAPKPIEHKPQFINANRTAKTAPAVQGGSRSSVGLNNISPVTAESTQASQNNKSMLSELDFSGMLDQTASAAPVVQSPSVQPKQKSLLSELDFSGSFGSETPATPIENKPTTQSKPRSLLSELDFGGSFGENTQTTPVEDTAASKPQPRSLLSELDFGGSFGSETPATPVEDTAASKPQPRSLLSELDFGGSFGDDTTSAEPVDNTASSQPRPRSLLSELDFGGDFGETSTVEQPAPVVTQKVEEKKAPVDDPVARRASIKMISFLSDKSDDTFAEITGVEKIPSNKPVEGTSPYGMHREEDDGMFFASRSNNTSFTQGSAPVQQQHPQPSPQPASYTPNNFAAEKPQVRPNSKDFSSDIVKNGTPAQRKYVEASQFDEWICPECGKTNQEYVGICACGRRKPRRKF